MSALWYDPFRWNDLLSDWCVYRSRHANDRPKGPWRLPLYQLLSSTRPEERSRQPQTAPGATQGVAPGSTISS